MQRQQISDMLDAHQIPKSTVAVCADVANGNVTSFLQFGKMSLTMEAMISQAVQDIARLIETHGSVPLDLGNAPRIKAMVREMNSNPRAYTVAIVDRPITRFLLRYDPSTGVLTTLKFLQAARVSLPSAEAIISDLERAGYKLALCENDVYGGPLASYNEAMGIQDSVVK